MLKISEYLNSLDIPVDGTYRGNCPNCYGKNTFTVTNDKGNIIYNCYRNSCGIKGTKHLRMGASQVKSIISNIDSVSFDEYETVMRQSYEMPPYLSVMKPRNEAVSNFMLTWHINPDDVFYDIRQDRVVFPIYHNRLLVDAVGRSIGNRKPKWLRYSSSPIPYMYGDGDTFVLVEDAISAYVVGNIFNNVVGVALLGTQLTTFHKWFFDKYYKYNKYIIALDYDAFNKTPKMVKELRGCINTVYGLKLYHDLKYCNVQDMDNLKEMINEC